MVLREAASRGRCRCDIIAFETLKRPTDSELSCKLSTVNSPLNKSLSGVSNELVPLSPSPLLIGPVATPDNNDGHNYGRLHLSLVFRFDR